VTRLRDLRFTPAPRQVARRGLLGWVQGRLGGVILDGIAVRRTARGHLTIAFPTRRDGRGREHAVMQPVNRAAREAIRRQVLRAAGMEEAS